MGKTLDSLKKVEQERLNKYTFAIEGATPKGLSPSELSQSNVKGTVPEHVGIGKTGILVLIGLLLIFNLILVITVIGLFTQRAGTFAKLNAIEQSVTENGKQISAISGEATRLADEIKAVNLHIKDISVTLAKSQESNDAQIVAIESLTKAKNTLFSRVNSLEVEISKIGATSAQ